MELRFHFWKRLAQLLVKYYIFTAGIQVLVGVLEITVQVEFRKA